MSEWRSAAHDAIQHSPLRWVFFSRHRWLSYALGVLVAASVAVGSGWVIARLGPLPILALLVGLAYLSITMQNFELAYWGVIGIITLLPFASLPVRIGFTPTFLDLTLLVLFALWLLPLALGREQRFIATPVGGAVFAFMLLAIGSFVFGLSHGALTSYLARHFVEILLSMALFFLVVNTVRDTARLERLTRILFLLAAAAAALGIVLYVLPDELTIRLLSALGRLGYPTGAGVLRFIRDDPELMQRATSTSVDPNVLGSLLNVTAAFTVPHLFAARPFIKRWLLLPLLGVVGLCLGLTISRGSMFGFAVAVAALGVLRYRKLLPLLLLGLILMLVLPWTQGYVLHFIEGLQLRDLSTQMRMGEYTDALTLIARYPILGVGFAASPDIDTYIGVANLYLLIAQEMGLVGLTAFLVAMGVIFTRFWRRRGLIAVNSHLEPLWYGLHAALLGGLVAGMLDHYFFSLDFHHSVTLFWLLVGLTTAATQLVDAQVVVDPEPHPV